ncbi:hypothetical protein K2173_023153 [Erythroxylum novogranatense]|uniref:Uncharacterized protein n=1 Tax=Erythroxylum novogranatense TaxID=1862640 RepID=A0AAV8UAP6_9ROSI|nr:hypothetical protein K2173_023153 [Erythroxylum novogranatense]
MSSSNYISYQLLPWMSLFLLAGIINAGSEQQLQTYIIQLDPSHMSSSFSADDSWHWSILKSLSEPVDDPERLLYSYSNALHGFSARLTESQLSEIENSPAHLATYKASFGKAHTTRSSHFLGLNHQFGLWPSSSYGDGVIIGVVDSGIWPESESFSDKGMPQVPKKWKGKCENGTQFSSSNCNKKLIGARSFSKALRAAGLKIPPPEEDYDSARDFEGHGTHTASTAAGNHVAGANCFGQARGIARGVAPRAHIAMYKGLFKTDMDNLAGTPDVLAAIDQAIADGVDILSMSLGFGQMHYYKDVIAIGALSAVEKGIFVSCSASNDGDYGTVEAAAEWITTVGASTIDRTFTSTLKLESGFEVEAQSYYLQNVRITNTSLYHGKGHSNKSICAPGALDRSKIAGKVVVCDQTEPVRIADQWIEVIRKGALAAIIIADELLIAPISYPIPTIFLPSASGTSLIKHLSRLNTEPKVKSWDMTSTKFGTKPAPQLGFFSSRGPNPVSLGTLKPDIIAPGVDILAAYTPNKPYMKLGSYDFVTDYAFESGTSMAAPHVAGIGALIKNVHPEWSPSAIRSALMTTAYVTDNTGSIIKDMKTGEAGTPLDFGSGHVDPNKAIDPGLIYDIDFQGYVEFICGLGYTEKQIRALIRKSHWSCSNQSQLNYPSFMAVLTNSSGSHIVKKYTRTVTNVGDGDSIYRSTIEHVPAGTKITVEPKTLSFSRKFQKRSYTLNLEIERKRLTSDKSYAFLKWSDQHNHAVSSPILVAEMDS